MKRFYCIECGRVKRARQYPADLTNQYASNPVDRVGTCWKHLPENQVVRVRRTSNQSAKRSA